MQVTLLLFKPWVPSHELGNDLYKSRDSLNGRYVGRVITHRGSNRRQCFGSSGYYYGCLCKFWILD